MDVCTLIMIAGMTVVQVPQDHVGTCHTNGERMICEAVVAPMLPVSRTYRCTRPDGSGYEMSTTGSQ
jgi:hypothetical protein